MSAGDICLLLGTIIDTPHGKAARRLECPNVGGKRTGSFQARASIKRTSIPVPIEYDPSMQGSDGIYWKTDDRLFLTINGAKMLADWFGDIPSFHDASMTKLEIANGNAELALQTFRMTDEVDANGYFILDRHALVTVHFHGVTGVSLSGDATSTIQELGIRRVRVDQAEWDTVPGPITGNFEVRWESSFGLEGAIFAQDVRFSLVPV
jgi:hypothetical protein